MSPCEGTEVRRAEDGRAIAAPPGGDRELAGRPPREIARNGTYPVFCVAVGWCSDGVRKEISWDRSPSAPPTARRAFDAKTGYPGPDYCWRSTKRRTSIWPQQPALGE